MSAKKSGPLPKILTVGQVAERSGVAVSTIHFYESKGLIASWRTDGNQRRYLRSVLRQVSVIKVAQQLGIPLAEVKETLGMLPADQVRPPSTGGQSQQAGAGGLMNGSSA